jgi:hypothetical protein
LNSILLLPHLFLSFNLTLSDLIQLAISSHT